MNSFISKCACPYIAIAEQYKDDMLNEARIAFLKSIKSFNYNENGFYNYVKTGICIAMRDYLKNNIRLIRIPNNKIEKYLKIRKVINEMIQNGEPISEEDVMKKCNIKSLKTFHDIMNSSTINNIVSYDNYISSDNDNTYERYISCSENFEEAFFNECEIEELKKNLNKLNLVDRYIIENYFGLNDIESKSLLSIASDLNIKYTEVLKEYKKIIDKLRIKLTDNNTTAA